MRSASEGGRTFIGHDDETSASSGMTAAAVSYDGGRWLRKMTYLTELFAAVRRREEGQTMAEYGVILAVITVLIIGALLLLSSGIERNIMSVVSVL
jgi:Flp pilus assembly pilin Flp